MSRSPAGRGTRAVALALLTMAALLAGACGKDGSGGPTDPIPNDPDPLRSDRSRRVAGACRLHRRMRSISRTTSSPSAPRASTY